jgi:hypothetical protein
MLTVPDSCVLHNRCFKALVQETRNIRFSTRTPRHTRSKSPLPCRSKIFCPRPRRFAMIRLGCVKGRSRFKPRRPKDDRESDDLKRILFVKVAAEDCAVVLQNTTATYHQRTSTKTSHESESHSKSRGPVAMTCLGIEKSRFCLQEVRGPRESRNAGDLKQGRCSQ